MAGPEIAIFLGAGASCSDGAPSQTRLFKDFFGESFEDYYRVQEENASLQQVGVITNATARFFERFFGFDPIKSYETAHFPTFEEVLGIIDLALMRDEGFTGLEGNLTPYQRGASLRKAREDFVFLIALILDKKLQYQSKYHSLLVDNLEQGKTLNTCAFLSFNYDLLIDNALGKLRRDFCDYAIKFANADIERPDPTILLKLHGSLNWLYCSVCRDVRLTPGEKGVCDLVFNSAKCVCPKCQSLTMPIIVPPTYFKAMSNIFLQQIWQQAEHVLSRCHTWIFCGYSFPDADMHVKYLLKRVQVNARTLRRVFVVNWHSHKAPCEAATEEERYRRLFGANTPVHYAETSFEEFAASPTVFTAQHTIG
jgi:NAD-dependent SIR2 family protein deacetylase